MYQAKSSDCCCTNNCASDQISGLSGVCCEVRACAHNDGNQHCTAPNITVKNRMAILGEETRCETFSQA